MGPAGYAALAGAGAGMLGGMFGNKGARRSAAEQQKLMEQAAGEYGALQSQAKDIPLAAELQYKKAMADAQKSAMAQAAAGGPMARRNAMFANADMSRDVGQQSALMKAQALGSSIAAQSAALQNKTELQNAALQAKQKAGKKWWQAGLEGLFTGGAAGLGMAGGGQGGGQ